MVTTILYFSSTLVCVHDVVDQVPSTEYRVPTTHGTQHISYLFLYNILLYKIVLCACGYVLKIYRPKYNDSKYIEYRLKIYRPQYIKVYAKCIYFLKRAGTRFRFTKKYEKVRRGLGVRGSHYLKKKNTYLVGPFYKKYIFSGAVL